MLDDLLWALVLVAILVLVVRGLGGIKSSPPAADPLAARLAAVEDELRDVKAQLRLLVERVWFLEQGRGAGGPQSTVDDRAAAGSEPADVGGLVPEAAGPGSPDEISPAVADVPHEMSRTPLGPPWPPAAPGNVPPGVPAPRAARDLEQRIGARWTTWVGVLAILFALSFFLRWAFERQLVGELARCLVGVAVGAALLVAGQRLHRRRDLPYLSEGLSGGGLGALYLSLYAAHVFYGFIGSGAAFYLMFLVTLAGAAVAVNTHRQVTAMLALIGGLLTPILLASGRPNERVLLGYVLVLDCLALAVARYRSWPALGYVAWAGSALLIMPGIERRPERAVLAGRLILLTAIWAVFLALPLVRELVERRRERELDQVLVVLNAAGYFYALYATLSWWAPGAQGPCALGLAAVYWLVAILCRRRVPDDALSAPTHVGVALTFLTVGIGLALRGPWITLAWAAQGLALLAVAPRAASPVASWGAMAALALAAGRVIWVDPSWDPPVTRVWNATFLAHLLVVTALAIGGSWARRLRPGQPPGLGAERARDALWLASALVLAALLWREPTGLWPAVLLSMELIAVGWLGRVAQSPAFLVATPLLAAAVLARILGADAPLARRAAARLVNAPLLVRMGACVAMALAGQSLSRAGAGPAWLAMSRLLSCGAAVLLLAVLSAGWVAHQDVARAAARRAGDFVGAEEIRWRMQVGLSVLWTIFASAALVWGFARSLPALRYGALALLGVVIAKVSVVDLAAVHTGYRIVSFLVLGLVLLGVSYLYQRRRNIDGAAGG
ncbi:MAG TPA: DUF2339 domain-containing protein [Candidatus Binatia bacterium]|nr:DUF2339 domain-containing protein [Candidatus Binatia bacterium]